MLGLLTFIIMILLLISGMIFHLYLYRHGALNSPQNSLAEERVILERTIYETVPSRG
jgi:hypothetical protein